MTPQQCDKMRTFLRTLVTYTDKTKNPDVSGFIVEYRKLFATFRARRKQSNTKIYQKVCFYCGHLFEGHMKKIYCSVKCRNKVSGKNYRKRQKEQKEHKQREHKQREYEQREYEQREQKEYKVIG